MKRAWIENGQIFMTEDDSLVIPYDWVQVPENILFEQLKIENDKITIKQEVEILNELKQQKLTQLKQIVYSLLLPTDWAIVKCSELGLNIADAYPDIKTQRDAIRRWNEQKEQEIQNAHTMEDLNKIDLIYGG